MFRRIFVFEHLFSCAGRSLAFASADLASMAILFYQIPPKRQARSSCAIIHGLDAYHLPGIKPEAITSRAPATECLHAHARVTRMSWLYESRPRDPIAARWCLRRSVVPRSDPPSPGSPHGATPKRSRFVARVPRACMGCDTCSSFTGKPPRRSFEDNPQ